MKRKIKTLEKLIEEFPSYHFDKSGNLVLDLVTVVSRDYLQYLGKETSDDYFEWFLEPLPEPKVRKLYAYRNDFGFITFCEYNNYKDINRAPERAPEYDLEFPEREEG